MDLSGVNDLYILQRSGLPLILSPDATGTPTVIHPAPILVRAAYLSPHELETGMQSATSQLSKDRCYLFAAIQCPDGPPYRSGILFTFTREINGVSWRDGAMTFLGARVFQFGAATTQGSWSWLRDAGSGRHGRDQNRRRTPPETRAHARHRR